MVRMVSSQGNSSLSSVDLEVELHDAMSGIDGYCMERERRDPEPFAAFVRVPRALAPCALKRQDERSLRCEIRPCVAQPVSARCLGRRAVITVVEIE